MTRHAPALLALSIIAVAGWTYNVNYDTRAALDRLSALRTEIAEQREALQVLRVEWAYLNAPDRLAGLVAAHSDALGLMPLVPEALGIAAAIPYPPREPDAAPAAPDALIAAAPPAGPTPPGPKAPERATVAKTDALIAAGPMPATMRPARTASDAARPASVGPEAEVMTVAALAEPEGTGAARPAVLARSAVTNEGAMLAPIPAVVEPTAGAETVPDALEAAIAAALVEVGVSVDGAGASVGPADIFGVAASGVPLPAARPGGWSIR